MWLAVSGPMYQSSRHLQTGKEPTHDQPGTTRRQPRQRDPQHRPQDDRGQRTSRGQCPAPRPAHNIAVTPFETAEDWENHRDGILASLAPVGTLEESLAGQVALNLWRLQRAGVYEAATASAGIEFVAVEAERQANIAAARGYDVRRLPSADDAGRLAATEKDISHARYLIRFNRARLAVLEQAASNAPDATPVDSEIARWFLEWLNDGLADRKAANDAIDREWPDGDDCPLGVFRRALARTAAYWKSTLAEMLAWAVDDVRETVAKESRKLRSAKETAERLRQRLAAEQDRQRLCRLLPDEQTVQLLARYQGQHTRQLSQAMQMLHQLQDRRKRHEQAPPAERTDERAEGSQPRPRGVKERCGTAVHISAVDAYREEYGPRVPCPTAASQSERSPTAAAAAVGVEGSPPPNEPNPGRDDPQISQITQMSMQHSPRANPGRVATGATAPGGAVDDGRRQASAAPNKPNRGTATDAGASVDAALRQGSPAPNKPNRGTATDAGASVDDGLRQGSPAAPNKPNCCPATGTGVPVDDERPPESPAPNKPNRGPSTDAGASVDAAPRQGSPAPNKPNRGPATDAGASVDDGLRQGSPAPNKPNCCPATGTGVPVDDGRPPESAAPNKPNCCPATDTGVPVDDGHPPESPAPNEPNRGPATEAGDSVDAGRPPGVAGTERTQSQPGN